MKTRYIFLLAAIALIAFALTPAGRDLFASIVGLAEPPLVETANGTVQGVTLPSGIHVFKGIPYAKPPVRDLRWREPQPPDNWEGVRLADRFGPQCMQQRVFGDMMFRSEGMSEDCLYLNVWTPNLSPDTKLPVLVYFFGGGFIAGDGSEFRYDGESMAQRGIVSVTLNYRLGIFGFFAHPELSAESPHGASGNYGLLDQSRALHWVRENIAAFGGDPDRITIAGESAGSASSSAQMASPLSRDLIAGAIGESGSVAGVTRHVPLADAEQTGVRFATQIGAKSLADLRALSSTELLEAASRPGVPRFSMVLDGYFFPKPPAEIYAAGEQANVPLLLGWNSEESGFRGILRDKDPTPENYAAAVRELYGDAADEVLKLYPASTEEEVIQAATDLAGDRFIGYSTWRWYELHRQTGNAPTYLYFYTHPRPAMVPEMGNATAGLAGGVVAGDPNAEPLPPARGAVHSAEIEYALGNLATNKVYAWTDDDYKVSETMQSYFANFIKTGNPNGPGLPEWPAAASGKDEPSMVMVIDVESRAVPERHRERYLFLDRYLSR